MVADQFGEQKKKLILLPEEYIPEVYKPDTSVMSEEERIVTDFFDAQKRFYWFLLLQERAIQL